MSNNVFDFVPFISYHFFRHSCTERYQKSVWGNIGPYRKANMRTTPQQYNKKPVKFDEGLDFLKLW